MNSASRLVEKSLTMSQERIRMYADFTGDDNPIHLDPEYAAASQLGGIVAHGTLSLSLIWQSLQQSFSERRVDQAELDVRFVSPAYLDDRLTVKGWSESGPSAQPDGKLLETYQVVVTNQHDQTIITGTVIL